MFCSSFNTESYVELKTIHEGVVEFSYHTQNKVHKNLPEIVHPVEGPKDQLTVCFAVFRNAYGI